jgi:predicted CxxxxCH...CXXCH cytochrome family protein
MRSTHLRPVLALVFSAFVVAGCTKSSSGASTSGLAPVGANHSKHLQGGVFAAGLSCSSCHASTGFVVDFSQNPMAQAAGATYDKPTQTCSNVACHGNFSFNGVNGDNPAVVWSDQTPLTCASCHGMPPIGHPPLAAGADAASCSACHSATVNADGTINVGSGAHLNGKAEAVANSCTVCHGDPNRVGSVPGTDFYLTSAPPAASLNAPAFAVGAHMGHSNPAASTAVMGPVACAECHVVPTDDAHAKSPPAAKVVFGPLASSGGAVPTWAAGTAGCAASYCHGNFTFNKVVGSKAAPVWTDTAPLTCTSCHGMPPTGHPPMAGSVTAAACSVCHPQSVDGVGNIVPGGGHLNGKADLAALGCSDCHGDAKRKGNMPGTDKNLASAPPIAPANAPTYAIGAHLGHSNPVAATALMGPIACGECHVIPADAAHATTPPVDKVVFGALSTIGGAAPTFATGTAGCAASYCHGNFSFNGISGSNATPIWTDTTPLTCTSCHGMPPTGHVALAGPVTAVSCAACHPKTINADGTLNLVDKGHLNGKSDTSAAGCAACHGDATRKGILAGTDVNLISSPPVSSPSAPASSVGAHLGHVNPSAASRMMAPIACAECHVVPGDSAHATNPPAQQVVFGALSKTGGAAPTWTAGTAGCAASYCHGNFNFNGVTGSTLTPIWTDAAALTCASCHGMPPAGHLAVAAPVTAASCAKCHPATVNADGSLNTVDNGHLNGKSDTVSLGCTSCHGDGTRKGNLVGVDLHLGSAPPVAPPGAPAFAVGAHLGHSNPTSASALMDPIACAECHTVPADAKHATNPPPQRVVFGPLSTAGGAVPSWSPTTAGCSASYCHGNFSFNGISGANATPIWSSTAAMTCTSCHGMPPAGHVPVASPATAATCSSCHPKAFNADGSVNLVDKGHLNGLADTSPLGCASCHGDAKRTGNLAGVDVNLVSAPPVAPPGAPANAVGAHIGHLNPTTASALMGPVACSECHAVPADSTHATSPPAQRVVFGPLARTGGAAPTWAAGTSGCAASYCHGNFAFGAISGANATPIWTDATPLTCVSCHGMPPTGHIAVAAPVTAASCALCHPKAFNANGSVNLVDRGHMNGLDDTSAVGCSTCHGDATRKGNLAGTDVNLTSSPPVAPTGAPAFAVGAHMGHLNPTAASYVMAPIACNECHIVPADSAHATNPPASIVVFGTLSKTGGAAPTFNAGTAGCAASYCHGNFKLGAVSGASATPIWTDTTLLTCTACHGMPPNGHPAYTGTPTAASCFQCHPQSVNADGSIKPNGGHINGKADGGGCTACHGAPPTTGKHTNSNHKNRSCDACHPTGYTATVALPAFHQNGVVDLGSQAGYSCGLKGCPTGTTGTCTNKCHGRESW